MRPHATAPHWPVRTPSYRFLFLFLIDVTVFPRVLGISLRFPSAVLLPFFTVTPYSSHSQFLVGWRGCARTRVFRGWLVCPALHVSRFSFLFFFQQLTSNDREQLFSVPLSLGGGCCIPHTPTARRHTWTSAQHSHIHRYTTHTHTHSHARGRAGFISRSWFFLFYVMLFCNSNLAYRFMFLLKEYIRTGGLGILCLKGITTFVVWGWGTIRRKRKGGKGKTERISHSLVVRIIMQLHALG